MYTHVPDKNIRFFTSFCHYVDMFILAPTHAPRGAAMARAMGVCAVCTAKAKFPTVWLLSKLNDNRYNMFNGVYMIKNCSGIFCSSRTIVCNNFSCASNLCSIFFIK